VRSAWRRSTPSGALMDSDSNTALNVEEIMRRIKEEVARNRSKPEGVRPGESFDILSDHASRSVIVQESRLFRLIKKMQNLISRLPFYHRIYAKAVKLKRFIPRTLEGLSLEDLCGYNDDSFIIAAYRLILSRNPEDLRLDHYRTLLRNNRISKVEIIGRLRYSREGRRGQVRVKGLLLRFACAILLRTPIVGRLFRWIAAGRLRE